MSDALSDALESYLGKWLDIQPVQRIALVYVDPGRYPGHIALAALEQELIAAAYGIHEPQVAAGKLHWWAEELNTAMGQGGRHPLSQVLFADPRARWVPAMRWLAPIEAALARLEEGTAADFATQLTRAERLHGALAALETAWWYGAGVESPKARRLAALNHLLHALRRFEDDAERDRLPLPMSVLARHGLDRAELRRSSAKRDEAVRAQLGELDQAWRAAYSLPGVLSVFRALEAFQAERLIGLARRAPQPLVVLRQPEHIGLRATFAAWRAARQWHRLAGTKA